MTIPKLLIPAAIATLLLVVAAIFDGPLRPSAPTALAVPNAQDVTNATRPNLSVSGDGEAKAEPDLAILTVGATALAPTAEAAMADVNRRVNAVIDGIKAQGVAERDIQTSGLSLQPIQRNRPSNDQSPPEIEAYRASNNVVVTVRTISRAGAILDSATANGANVIRAQALANAVRVARGYAEEMARAGNVQLGEVIAIAEEGAGSPLPRAETQALRSSDASTPVQPGELTVRARVRLTYAISP